MWLVFQMVLAKISYIRTLENTLNLYLHCCEERFISGGLKNVNWFYYFVASLCHNQTGYFLLLFFVRGLCMRRLRLMLDRSGPVPGTL